MGIDSPEKLAHRPPTIQPERIMSSDDRLCTACGHIGAPETATKGHRFIEVLLWLCFLVPGLIYSIWRESTRHSVCGKCGATALILTDSPVARMHMKELGIAPAAPIPPPPPHKPSKAAYGTGRALGRLFARK